MNYSDMKLVVDTLENSSTDHKDLLKRLIDAEYVTFENIFTLIGGKATNVNTMINGVSITPDQYNTYLNLNKQGQAIPAIKAIRCDHALSLYEAKQINDFIKERTALVRTLYINGAELTQNQYQSYISNINNKIAVIRDIRHNHGLGLKEAKDIADTIHDRVRYGTTNIW